MPVTDLFKKLVESELLTEETKNELEKELNAYLTEAVTTAVEAAKKETEEKVRTELTEQFVADKASLIEAVDTKVTEFLNKEIAELKDDISKYQDLEVQYAEKLEEEKAAMAATVKSDMGKLVDRLDEFLEERLTEELSELKESIEDVRKLEMGRKIFEAVESEFAAKFAKTDASAVALAKANDDLKSTNKVLEGVQTELNAVKRQQKLAQVLESLQGRPREVMAAILNNVPTDKLEENYNKYIGRVLHESVKVEDTKSEKENDKSSVLAEGKDSTGNEAATKVVTGDTPVVEQETSATKDAPILEESKKERLKKLAGIL
jgi:hypothetical protein